MREYPALPVRYATALREAVDFVFARFEPCAVVAAGTIVRGNPSPSSDLDVYVLHHASYRQRLQRFFSGVPAEIFVNPPSQVERYLEEEARAGRPITAHMLATGFVVYSGDDCLPRLRQLSAEILARGPQASERELLVHRYMAATLFEDAVDVATSDPEASTAILNRAVEEAVRYTFWRERLWQPRPKDVFRRLADVEPAAAQHALAYYRAASLEARLAAGRSLFDALEMPTGFFEWDMEPETVA